MKLGGELILKSEESRNQCLQYIVQRGAFCYLNRLETIKRNLEDMCGDTG